MSGEEWLNADFSAEESEIVIGTSDNAIVRPLTKNLIEAPDKSFKTTFLMRLALGISTGDSVFASLPVKRPRRVLYLHGELASAELKERLQAAATGISRPLDNFFQGRSLDANLITPDGRAAIESLIKDFTPEVLVVDPWQSFIAETDENSFKEQSGVTRFLDGIISKYGLTLMLAVHQGKNTTRGARGHSSLAGWRDTRFLLKRDRNQLGIKVEPRWGSPVEVTLTFRHGNLWQGHVPEWGDQAEEIRKLLMANHGELTRDALGLGLSLQGGALRMALKRAQDSGAIQLNDDNVTLPPVTPTSPNHPI